MAKKRDEVPTGQWFEGPSGYTHYKVFDYREVGVKQSNQFVILDKGEADYLRKLFRKRAAIRHLKGKPCKSKK